MIGVSDIKVIPFAQTNQTENWMEYTETSGVLRLTAQQLLLDFQYDLFKMSTTTGTYTKKKSEMTTLDIPLAELEDITLKRNLFATKITIQVKRLDLLRNFPAQKSGVFHLNIKRNQIKNAEALISRALLIRSEILLDTL